jgi:uncharacterized protein YneF (UPF0154 family)
MQLQKEAVMEIMIVLGLLLGLVFGFWVGSKDVQDSYDLDMKTTEKVDKLLKKYRR